MTLISKAKQNSDLIVCSIFVNPTQFNNSEDLEKYPRTIDEDLALNDLNCDVVYLPEVSDLYYENEKVKQFHFNGLDKFMEGRGRKGHFNGVVYSCREAIQNCKSEHSIFWAKRTFNNYKLLNT